MGDAGLLVTIGDELDLDANKCAHRLAAALGLRPDRVRGLGTPVPGHSSVLVPFDPEVIAEATVRAVIAAELLEGAGAADLATTHADAVGGATRGAPESGPAVDPVTHASGGHSRPGSLHVVPVSYGGADGPDLADVAARTGLSEAEVVRLHSDAEYTVLVLGFMPGFPYLGILPVELDLPRRATPRVRVPAGSVAITGRQTGIYPFASPGGWHLIGRTSTRTWDPATNPPTLMAPGDRVRFVAG